MPQPNQATIQKIADAWDATVLKIAGDAADCVAKFTPVSNSGAETAEMRANQDKLLDSMKHFPFFGLLVAIPTLKETCTCDTGFEVPELYDYPGQCRCVDYAGGCEHTPCDDGTEVDCRGYTSTACTGGGVPSDLLMNLAQAGASPRLFTETTRVARTTG